MRRFVLAVVAACMWAGTLGFADTPALPADSFAAEFAGEVAEFKALSDFSLPVSPTPRAPVSLGPSQESREPYSLDELLALAAARNSSLRAAGGATAAARAQLDAAKARRLPTLSTETSATLMGNPVGPISLTAGELGSVGGVLIPPEDVLIYKGMERTYYQFSVTAEVPVYTWGKIGLGIDLAKAGVSAAELQGKKAAHELGVRIRGVYEALGYVRQICLVLDLQARMGRRLVELAERSAEAGFMTTADLLGARIRLKETDLAASRAEEKRDKLLSELAAVVGLEDLRLDQLELEVCAAGAPRWSQDQAYALISEGSYDLALLSALLEAKRGLYALAKAEAKGLPDIGLRLEASYGGSRFPLLETDWFGQDDYALNLSLGTSGAIFGSAVKAGEAAKASAEIEETLARREEAERSIRGFVRETYLTIELDRAKLEYAALKQEAWAADLAQRRATIQAGAGSESDYLGLMLEALAGLAEAYGTMAEYRSSLLSLEGAAGSRAGE